MRFQAQFTYKSPWDVITPLDIYRCNVRDFNIGNLLDSSSSRTKRQVNALFMSWTTYPNPIPASHRNTLRFLYTQHGVS